MKNMIHIAMNTLKVTFRKKSNIIVFLILPVLIVVLAMSLFGKTASSAVRIGISNEDQGRFSKDMIKEMEVKEKFNIVMIKEEDIKDMVSNGKVDCVLRIPQNFTENMYSNRSSNVELVSIKGEDATVWIETYINFYIGNLLDISLASEGNRESFNKMYSEYKASKLSLKVEKLQDVTNSKMVTSTGLGFLIMFMMMSATVTSSLILKEKKNRTYFRILSAPINSKQYIAGNVTANMAIVLVQSILVIVGMTKVLGINTFVPDAQLLIILLSFGLVSIGFGMVIVAFSDSSTQAGNLSTLIITPSCMLGGCFWEVTLMPGFLQKVSSFTPQRWVLQAVYKLQSGAVFGDILIHLIITLGFAATFFLVAAYRFSTSDNVKNFV